MNRIIISFYLLLFVIAFQAESATSYNDKNENNKLPGFVTSPYFDEQEISFTCQPGINILINAPSTTGFDKNKPTKLVLYALPNGNTTDQTIGKRPASGDDWHYHIQHIGAQTRYVRTINKDYNIITVYLEADIKSWGQWRKAVSGRDITIKETVEYIYSMFSPYHPEIELNSHSGGGNFIFGFIDAVDYIPAYVKKISFIDSNYNWNNERHGRKLKNWLEQSPDNILFVACYDDGNALLNGKPFISRKNGTWNKTHMMQRYLKKNMKQLKWNKTENDSVISFTTDNRNIFFYSRKNPEHKIYHTVLVERNGFIQSVLAGTEYENNGYSFMGVRAYDDYIQDSIIKPHIFSFPPRIKNAVKGSEFAHLAADMTAEKRDSVVYNEIAQGNIPDIFRQNVYITDTLQDAKGNNHEVTLSVLPDVLAIGTDTDFLRIPMLPLTAQKLADLYKAILPTRKISDLIHSHSSLKLTPHPMTPDSTMVTIPVFTRHDSIIQSEIPVIEKLWPLTAGHKKDIVITNRIATEPGRLFIYGWHYPNGKAIQPLSAAHNTGYVDYSHGIRLVHDEVLVDGKLYQIKEILQHPVFYKLLSDEDTPMQKPGY